MSIGKQFKKAASFTPFTGFGALGGGGFLGKGGILRDALSGAETSQTIPPSAMDLFNAKVIAALAPIFFQKMAPGLSGIGTSEGAGQQAQAVGKGVESASKQQLAPGTSQMFSMIDSMGQPGSAKKTADMMLLMYGKQPNLGPTGGESITRPGAMDYTKTAANIAGLFEKAQNPLLGQQPTYNQNYQTPSQPNQYFQQESFPRYF